MNRYPGNHMDSGIVTLPRQLKTRPGAPQTHLAYITGDEAQMLQKHKPGTPHGGPHGIPNYDSFSWDPQTGAATEAGSGSDWSGGTAWASYGGNQGAGQSGSGGNVGDATYEEVWAHSGGEQPDTYQPPSEIYGQGTVGAGETYEWTGHNKFYNLLIQDLSPETLNFWGINKNSQTIPVELYQQLMEGMIVSGNEAELSNEWGVGTWNELESGNHPGFEWLADQMGEDSGLDVYYNIMGQPTITPDEIFNNPGGRGGGRGGPGWGGPGWGGWGGSSQYGNPHGRYSKANWHLKNKYNYDSPIAALFAERRANPVQPQDIRLFTEMMANMNKGGIIGLRR